VATRDVNYSSGGYAANEVDARAKVGAHCVRVTDVDGVDKSQVLSNWVGFEGGSMLSDDL
jgi:hypothetical protein